MGNPLLSRLGAALAEARRTDLLRVLDARDGPQGPTIVVDGETLINFTSNDYLGLAADPRILTRIADALPRHGFGSGAAALLSGRSSEHAELERCLAAFTGFPAGLLFSSGYLANLGALPALAGRSDFIAHDRLNHASLIDAVLASGAQHRRYAHGDVDNAAALLATAAGEARFVVTESVYSMDGDSVDLERLVIAARTHEATLYVDDAHGFGVTGAHGRGAASLLSSALGAQPLVLMLTFGKAFGGIGAMVLADTQVIDHLVQSARTFVYDTALPPVCAVAALAALDIIVNDPLPRSRLDANVALFRRLAQRAGLPLLPSQTPIQAIMIGAPAQALALAHRARAAGFYVRAIRPPTVPRGTARLRITVTAAHDEMSIADLVDVLAEAIAV